MNQIAILRDLFVHRTDTFAVQKFLQKQNQWVYWRVTRGTCPNQPPCPRQTCQHIVSVPLTEDVLRRHLDGEITVGVYQVGKDNTVKWLCIDIDIDKNVEDVDPEELWVRVREHTRVLARTFQRYRLPFLVEFSGNRGFHIWVFFHEPVAAIDAQRLGRFIAGHAEPPDGIHVEIFPKQAVTLSFGNLVKLPLGIHQKTGKPCVFLGPGFKEFDDPWQVLGQQPRLSAEALAAFLHEHAGELPEEFPIEPNRTLAFGLPCLQTIMEEGVAAGLRDESAFLLSCYMRAFGLPSDLALAALFAWNQRNDPPLDEFTIKRKVKSGYSQGYSYFPCRKPHFDKYCVTSCRFYERKAKERGMT